MCTLERACLARCVPWFTVPGPVKGPDEKASS